MRHPIGIENASLLEPVLPAHAAGDPSNEELHPLAAQLRAVLGDDVTMTVGDLSEIVEHLLAEFALVQTVPSLADQVETLSGLSDRHLDEAEVESLSELLTSIDVKN